MAEVTIIGIDLGKRVFQLHGASKDRSVVFRKKLSRGQVPAFISQQSRCVVTMAACATAHGWGRELEKLGHDVRMIPPVNVKPIVKRQKNDVADAEAIVEAALRPKMRFVARRLQTMPDVGPIAAFTIETFAPELSSFQRGRDFAVRLGLVPKQHSTGGKARLGKTSKMGQRETSARSWSRAPWLFCRPWSDLEPRTMAG